jgi:hypothetical protein
MASAGSSSTRTWSTPRGPFSRVIVSLNCSLDAFVDTATANNRTRHAKIDFMLAVAIVMEVWWLCAVWLRGDAGEKEEMKMKEDEVSRKRANLVGDSWRMGKSWRKVAKGGF